MIDSTIVITNYNQGHLLDRSLSSAINQNYPHKQYEIIIVDDGSTDNSVEIAHKLISTYLNNTSDLTIKLITKENGGTASARNAGIDAASGNVIAFLDADDEYLPNKLSESIKIMNKYHNVGVVYSDYFETFPDNTKKIVYKPSFNRDILFSQCIVSTNSCIHRSVIDKVGYFDSSIKGCEDYDFWLRIAYSNIMILHIPEPLFIYHNHNLNKTVTFNPNMWAFEEQKIRQRIIKGDTLYVSNT